LKNLVSNLIFSVVFTLFLILPDFIANFFWQNYYTITSKNTFKEILITFIISFLISTLKPKIRLFFSAIFIIFSLGEIGYFSYFRTYFAPYQIDLIFQEFKDVIDSASLVATIAVGLTTLLFAMLYILSKIKTKTFKYSTVLFLSILIAFPFIIAQKKSIYIPNSTHFGYLNTLFAMDLWIINKLSPHTSKEYKDYKVKKINSGKKLVVVVMGESLNYKRMGLYGWDINTTPYLNKLKNDPNFQYFKAISSGVNTPVSMVSFFNIKREPDNTKLLLSQKTNLLKLAKENNYTTYWLSMQEEGTSISTLLNYADYKKTRKDFDVKFDDSLLKELKKLNLSKKSFIILHLRTNHSPYEEYTPTKFYKWRFDYDDYHKYKVYSYYNSILYVDYILSNIINYLKDKNASIYFTSDHAEMLGFRDEKGAYGHSRLSFLDSFVPFIHYGNKIPNQFYNHYIISKLIAKDLGYQITNPNENGSYYLNGTDIEGKNGFLKYTPKQIK